MAADDIEAGLSPDTGAYSWRWRCPMGHVVTRINRDDRSIYCGTCGGTYNEPPRDELLDKPRWPWDPEPGLHRPAETEADPDLWADAVPAQITERRRRRDAPPHTGGRSAEEAREGGGPPTADRKTSGGDASSPDRDTEEAD